MDTIDEDKLGDLLPVHYLVLDPARIPTAEYLESCSPDMIRTVDVALLSLQAVFDMGIASNTAVDLWPRVWAWVEFLQMFRQFLGAFKLDIPSEDDLYDGFLTFTRYMCDSPQRAALVLSAPGFPATAVRAWAYFVASHDVPRQTDVFRVVLPLLADPTVADEIIEGAGGSIDDLAQLVMRQLSFVSADRDAGLSAQNVTLLEHLLTIVVSVAIIPNPRIGVSQPLWNALISRGFVKALIIATSALGHTATPDADIIIEKCLVFLTSILATKEGYRVLRLAVQDGLLGAIVACRKRDIPLPGYAALTSLLTQLLAPATVYCYLLFDLSKAYFAVENDVAADESCRPEFLEAWTRFSQILLQRFAVLQASNSEEHILYGSCDNVHSRSP